MTCPSHHAQRAREELERSRAAADPDAAGAHRELALLHLRQLAAGNPQQRLEAEAILAEFDLPSEQLDPPAPGKPRGKLGLRFG